MWEYVTPSGDSAGYWQDGAGDFARISFDKPAELIDNAPRNKWALSPGGVTGGWVNQSGQFLANEDFALIPYSVRALGGNDPDKLLTGFQSSEAYIDEYSSYFPGVRVKGWDSAKVDPERGLLLHYSDINVNTGKAGAIVAGLIGSLFGPVAAGALAAGFSGDDVPGPFEIVKGGAKGYIGGEIASAAGFTPFPGIIENAQLPSLSDFFSNTASSSLTSTGTGVVSTTTAGAGAAAAAGAGIFSTLKDALAIGTGVLTVAKLIDNDSPPAPQLSLTPASSSSSSPSAADKLLEEILKAGSTATENSMATAQSLAGNKTNAGNNGAQVPAAGGGMAAIDWQPLILIAVAAVIALAFLDGKD